MLQPRTCGSHTHMRLQDAKNETHLHASEAGLDPERRSCLFLRLVVFRSGRTARRARRRPARIWSCGCELCLKSQPLLRELRAHGGLCLCASCDRPA